MTMMINTDEWWDTEDGHKSSNYSSLNNIVGALSDPDVDWGDNGLELDDKSIHQLSG